MSTKRIDTVTTLSSKNGKSNLTVSFKETENTSPCDNEAVFANIADQRIIDNNVEIEQGDLYIQIVDNNSTTFFINEQGELIVSAPYANDYSIKNGQLIHTGRCGNQSSPRDFAASDFNRNDFA